MAHLVYIKAKDDKKFNYASFAAYKNKEGKTIKLLDPDGKEMEKWEMHSPMQGFDLENEYDARVWKYLQEHPLVKRAGFTFIDSRQGQQDIAAKAIASAEAVTTATSMSPSEYDDMARLIGISKNFDDVITKAKILQYANSSPAKFLELFNNKDKDYYVFLKKAEEKNLLTFVNGVWKYGANSIGLTDETAIEWLKENKDIYALMRNQLRGNAPAAVSEMKPAEVVETKKEDVINIKEEIKTSNEDS